MLGKRAELAPENYAVVFRHGVPSFERPIGAKRAARNAQSARSWRASARNAVRAEHAEAACHDRSSENDSEFRAIGEIALVRFASDVAIGWKLSPCTPLSISSEPQNRRTVGRFASPSSELGTCAMQARASEIEQEAQAPVVRRGASS